MRASGAGSVMASRREPPDSLDFFPTPPPATRAFLKHVLPIVSFGTPISPPLPEPQRMSAWEPACGQGHMAAILAEAFNYVFASDIFDYGYGNEVDFLADFAAPAIEFDWIVTNPPFNKGLDFVRRAIPIARCGAAMLLRTVWLEGGDTSGRFSFFQQLPPTHVFVFAERMNMLKGRWDPYGVTSKDGKPAKSATSYAWFVWRHPIVAGTALHWIPPGCKAELTLQRDFERFAVKRDAPLLEGTS
jgi:hypothetical protein